MYFDIPHLTTIGDADLREMRQRHSDFAGIKEPIIGGTKFYADDAMLSQADLEMALTKDLKIEKTETYVQMPFSQLDNLVTVSMPDAKYMDENGEEVRRIWSEYAPFYNVNVAGDSVLVRCVHVQYGETSANGTDDAELRAWLAEFGSVICKQNYTAMMATPEWQIQEEVI